MLGRYILVDREPVPCEDLMEWARWVEGPIENRRVGRTEVGDYVVYTSFLSLDHNWIGIGQLEHVPILFETMIRHDEDDQWLDYQERYATWAEAEAGHKRAVAFALSLSLPDYHIEG